jgi:serine/threonine protein kinase
MTLIGQSLGHYHILEQLGEGGMATVYKAYDTHLERDVAVKVIRLDQFSPASLREVLTRFEREAKSLARLTHPNIVNISDYGEQDNIPYLVMEYLPGGTLKDKLGKPMRWQEVCKLLLPIAQALDFAHEQNLIHRDVKPSNILLTKKGQPMLTDFGIAKILDAGGQTLTATGVGIGTPEYMAPEQWMGKTTHQSDIYSLGVVMYEMITGRPPFTADTPAAILIKQINDPLPRPTQFISDLPEAVEKVLIKAMAKESSDRYHTMDDLAKALEGLLLSDTTREMSIPPILASVDNRTLDTELPNSPESKKDSGLKTVAVIEKKVAESETIVNSHPSMPSEAEMSSGKPAIGEADKLAGKMPQRQWIWVIAGLAVIGGLWLGISFFNSPSTDDVHLISSKTLPLAATLIGQTSTSKPFENSTDTQSVTGSPSTKELWIAIFTYAPPHEAWNDGSNHYSYWYVYTIPKDGQGGTGSFSFSISNDASPHEGYVLLLGQSMQARVDGMCREVDPILKPDQDTRSLFTKRTTTPMTYDEAKAHFTSMAVTFRGSTLADPRLMLQEIVPVSSVSDLSSYLCKYTK